MTTIEQLEIYDQLWEQFSRQIRDREGIGGFRPESSERICTTIISRLRQPVSTFLSNFIAPLRTQNPEHYYYPASDYHFTLLDISPIVLNGNFGCLSTEAASGISTLAKSMLDEQPLRLSARGLGVFPTTVFLQLLDVDGRVTELRDKISRIIEDELSIRLKPPLVPGLVFANTVRFCQVPTASILDFVSAARETPSFEFEANELEVVSTDKALSGPATIVHERIQLRGSDYNASAHSPRALRSTSGVGMDYPPA